MTMTARYRNIEKWRLLNGERLIEPSFVNRTIIEGVVRACENLHMGERGRL